MPEVQNEANIVETVSTSVSTSVDSDGGLSTYLIKTIISIPVILAALKMLEWHLQNRKASTQAIRSYNKIYVAINTAMSVIEASRVMVFKIHNDGAKLSSTTPLYFTSLYEVVSDVSPRLVDWSNVKVDETILNALGKVSQKTWAIFPHTAFNPNSIIGSADQHDHTKCHWIAHVRSRSKDAIYVLATFKCAAERCTGDEACSRMASRHDTLLTMLRSLEREIR